METVASEYLIGCSASVVAYTIKQDRNIAWLYGNLYVVNSVYLALINVRNYSEFVDDLARNVLPQQSQFLFLPIRMEEPLLLCREGYMITAACPKILLRTS